MAFPSKANNHVLVLGGTGYIGKGLISELIQTGAKPVVICRSSDSWQMAITHWASEIDKGAITLLAANENILSEEVNHFISHNIVSACFNLIGNSSGNQEVLYQSNVDATVQVAELFFALKMFHANCINYHFSSIATAKKADLSTYAETKLAGENVIRERGKCDYIVYHSIVDTNAAKIAQDINPLIPILINSASLLDKAELSTISLKFLTHTLAWHLSLQTTLSNRTRDLVIVENELSLRTFLHKVLGAELQVIDQKDLSLDQVEQEIKDAIISDAVKKRFLNFVRLARIDDQKARLSENHYFHFGKIADFKTNYQYVANDNAANLYRSKQADYIFPN